MRGFRAPSPPRGFSRRLNRAARLRQRLGCFFRGTWQPCQQWQIGSSRPIADLRAIEHTISYRKFSAPLKLAFHAAGIARVYTLPPWNMARRATVRCQISFTIGMTFDRSAGPGNDRVLHPILHYATALLTSPAGMPLLYFEIQNRLADGRKMRAAEWERNRNTRVFHNFADSAGMPR